MVKLEILFNEEEISRRIDRVADMIRADFPEETGDLLLLGILKGASVFLSDLMRRLGRPCSFDFLNEKMEHGIVFFSQDADIAGKNVIVLKDVVHSGVIESYLIDQLKTLHPRTIRIACLIDRPKDRKVDIHVDYALFSSEEEILAGYGMDYVKKFGNLPYIGKVIRKREE